MYKLFIVLPTCAPEYESVPDKEMFCIKSGESPTCDIDGLKFTIKETSRFESTPVPGGTDHIFHVISLFSLL